MTNKNNSSNGNGKSNGKPKGKDYRGHVESNAPARAFLAAYAEIGNLTRAAELAQVERTHHYRWMKTIEGYPEAFEDAKEKAADRLEQEARRRAVEGVPEPVFYKGEAVGAIKKFSDILLMFLLKGMRPEKFRDRYQIEHAGKIEHKHTDEAHGILQDDEVRHALERAGDRLRFSDDQSGGAGPSRN